MRYAVTCVVLAAGCGRLGFDPMGTPDAASIDATTIDGAVGFDFSDPLTCTTTLVLVGDAACTGGMLELTPDAPDRVGAAYLRMPELMASRRLETHLTLRFRHATMAPPGDGFVFMVHGDPRGSGAIGSGGSMGYDAIRPSLGVELDSFHDALDPDGNHVGYDRDGDLTSIATGMPPLQLADGQVFHLWVDVDGPGRAVSVFVARTATKPVMPILALAEDLARLGPTAWVGLVAGTQFAQQAHDVLAWDVSLTP